jgi:hypothetical protein
LSLFFFTDFVLLVQTFSLEQARMLVLAMAALNSRRAGKSLSMLRCSLGAFTDEERLISIFNCWYEDSCRRRRFII